MSKVEEYRALVHESQYNLVVKEAIIMAADAAIAEQDATLRMAYENADFDEPLTFDEYRADLRKLAAARAWYLAKRAGDEA